MTATNSPNQRKNLNNNITGTSEDALEKYLQYRTLNLPSWGRGRMNRLIMQNISTSLAKRGWDHPLLWGGGHLRRRIVLQGTQEFFLDVSCTLWKFNYFWRTTDWRITHPPPKQPIKYTGLKNAMVKSAVKQNVLYCWEKWNDSTRHSSLVCSKR